MTAPCQAAKKVPMPYGLAVGYHDGRKKYNSGRHGRVKAGRLCAMAQKT